MEVFMATVRKNITLKEEEVIIFNDYCKKTGQTLSELLRNSALKFIKEVEEMDLAEYIKLNCKKNPVFLSYRSDIAKKWDFFIN